MSDIKIDVGLNSAKAKKGLTDLKGAIGGVGKGAESITGSFLKLAAAAGGIAAVTKGLTGIASTGGQFEQLQNSLNTVFGGLKEGNQAMSMATKIANDTGMSIESLAESMIQLKGAGVEPTVAQLTAFADAAAVSKDAAGAFDAAISLVSRTTAGGLGLEELERLGDRGIPVYEMLNKKLGITRLEVSEVGKTAEGAARIIGALTEAMTEQFGGAALRNATTFGGVMNQLKNSVKGLQTQLFKSGFGQAFKEATGLAKIFIEEITNVVDSQSEQMAKSFSGVGTRIFSVVESVALGAAAMYDQFQPLISLVFTTIREGVNNLMSFHNSLPDNLKTFGLIGFMMLGMKGKAIIFLISAAFDGIMKVIAAGLNLLTPVMNFFVDLSNQALKVINKAIDLSNEYLGTDFKKFDPLEKFKEGAHTAESVGSAIKQELASVLEFVGGVVEDIPLIGKGGNTKAVENVTSLLDTVKGKFDSFKALLDADPIEIIPTDGGDNKGDAKGGFMGGFKTAFDTFKTNVNDTKTYAQTIFDTMTDGFTKSIMTFVETGKLSFKDLFKSLMTEIIKMQANKMFLALFGGAQSFFSGLFMDKGGYIPTGQFGIVGEKGPEIVNGPARVTGRMETARQLGGGSSGPNIVYNISAVDVQSFRQALARDPQYIYNLTRVGQRRMPA